MKSVAVPCRNGNDPVQELNDKRAAEEERKQLEMEARQIPGNEQVGEHRETWAFQWDGFGGPKAHVGGSLLYSAQIINCTGNAVMFCNAIYICRYTVSVYHDTCHDQS